MQRQIYLLSNPEGLIETMTRCVPIYNSCGPVAQESTQPGTSRITQLGLKPTRFQLTITGRSAGRQPPYRKRSNPDSSRPQREKHSNPRRT